MDQATLPGLEPASPALPDGLVYAASFLSPAEEERLRREVSRLSFGEVRMRGVIARRRVAHFGYDYAYEGRRVAPGPPLPAFLLAARARAAGLAGVPADALAEALVTWYPRGAGIGWHRDAPAFDVVVGISLGAPARLRLREGGPGGALRELLLAPGSAYVISGTARWRWQHTIPPLPAERWSITFRSMRSPRPPPGRASS